MKMLTLENRYQHRKIDNKDMKMKTKNPFKPVATIDDIIAYRLDDEATHTPSPLVNAFAEALIKTNSIQCKDIAEYMELDCYHLSVAMNILTGHSLMEILHAYKLNQIHEYMQSHEGAPLEEVAKAAGYSSYRTMWRFFQRRFGTTPSGKKSNAGPELGRK